MVQEIFGSDNKSQISDSSKSVDESVDHGEGVLINGKFQRNKGLHWFVTGIFVIAALSGSGLVVLGTAMSQSGLFLGTLTFVVIAVAYAYTAHILGQCWGILQRRN
uniref:Amino acid transporter transmembrane domain-containing protein n=1 Tax=Acrobeloides nanus TaxID=290746 RepID=A0A914CUE2_9BILA